MVLENWVWISNNGGLPLSAVACVILPRGKYFTSKDAGAFTVWNTASLVYIIENSALKRELEKENWLWLRLTVIGLTFIEKEWTRSEHQ